MCEDHISSDSKLLSLRSELTKMHNDSRFDQCKTMGEVTFPEYCNCPRFEGRSTPEAQIVFELPDDSRKTELQKVWLVLLNF